jgi:hypothetical protein
MKSTQLAETFQVGFRLDESGFCGFTNAAHANTDLNVQQKVLGNPNR